MSRVVTDHGLLNPDWAGAPAAALCDDHAVVQAMLDVELAWATVCVEAGLSRDAAPQSQAWQVASYDVAELARRSVGDGNPLIPLLADLRSTLRAEGHPDAAAGVHVGSTSQDILDTALMLVAAQVIDDILPRLVEACDALAGLTAAHRNTICVARTLGQHALPTTFGARAGVWLDGLSSAAAALAELRGSLPLQWAGAGGTSAALVQRLSGTDRTVSELRARLAATLGLTDRSGWQAERSTVVGLGVALAGICSAAGKLGTDVATGSRIEIGELAEPSGPGRGGSSAMPHKRNPVLSVLLRSAAMSAPAHVSILQLTAGLATDERPDGAWHAQWPALRDLLRLAAGSASQAAELAGGLHVDTDALARNLALSRPAVLSERIVAAATAVLDGHDGPNGPDGPDASARARALVDDALASPDPESALRESLSAFLSDEQITDLLDPAQYLGNATELADDAVRRHQRRHLQAGTITEPTSPATDEEP